MEQNNFEKNIQQKMGDLKIAPSDSVWPNIEKKIGKKDKKRRAFFIIFLLLLCLSLGGIWLTNSLKNNPQKNEPIANILKESSKPTNTRDSSFQQKMMKGRTASKSDTASIIANNSKIKSKSIEKNAFGSKKLTINYSKIKSPASKQTNNEENYFNADNKNNSFTKKEGIIETKIERETAGLQEEIKNDSLTDQPKLEILKKETAPIKSSLAKKNQTKDKKHPWNFGVTVSRGIPITEQNLKASNFYNNSGYVTSGAPVYYFDPSEIKNSASFDAGVFLEKNISDKNKISIGISYQYFSFVNKVGSRIAPSSSNLSLNSSGNFYGAGNALKPYRNNFHFLEVPVSFKFRLNKNKYAPLFWNAGINISELIGSNALQFQSYPGVYYNDNSLLNKSQLGLETGFSIELFSKEKTPLTIGPYFYYSPTNIATKRLYSRMHFSFIGIRAEMLFRKK